ncbi:MAG TPA: hypothetical protein VJ779_02110, partial [Acetobacteraceae bacterium]|nr:hypothetical protein [Acetobacteraceae bacterium]
MDGFLAALEHRIPLRTAATAQEEGNKLARRQLAQLETFSTDLAVSMGSAMDAAFDQRLGDHIGPLTEVIRQLAAGLSERNESAMAQMLDAFLQKLQGGAGERMNEVADRLARLGDGLHGLQTGLQDAAGRMADAADTMA